MNDGLFEGDVLNICEKNLFFFLLSVWIRACCVFELEHVVVTSDAHEIRVRLIDDETLEKERVIRLLEDEPRRMFVLVVVL